MTRDKQKDMVDKRMERELVLKYWTQNKTEEEIANLMDLTAKQVYNYIYGTPVTLSQISNEEELVQTLWARGKTADEIAGILGIEVWIVQEYLERVKRDD